jgi:hypothetical protein
MPVFEKEKSKIKMVILTKGRDDNVVWHSPINQNSRDEQDIIKSMLNRLKRKELFNRVNVVQFYTNNLLIAEFKYSL